MLVMVALPAVLLSRNVRPPCFVMLALPARWCLRKVAVPALEMLVMPLVSALTTSSAPLLPTPTAPRMEPILGEVPSCRVPSIDRGAAGIGIRTGQGQRTGADLDQRAAGAGDDAADLGRGIVGADRQLIGAEVVGRRPRSSRR